MSSPRPTCGRCRSRARTCAISNPTRRRRARSPRRRSRQAARDPSRNEDGLYPEEQGLHDEDDGSQDKFGQASIAILQVALVVGAAVAPFFFF